MPSGKVSPVTRPNSVSTPTWPVGTDVVLHSSSNNTNTATAMRKIREPASLKFGIEGIEPPRSIVPRVGFTIFPPSRGATRQGLAARTGSIIYYARGRILFSTPLTSNVPSPRLRQRDLGQASSGCFLGCEHKNVRTLAILPSATRPLYVAVFLLDSTGTARHNARQDWWSAEIGRASCRERV